MWHHTRFADLENRYLENSNFTLRFHGNGPNFKLSIRQIRTPQVLGFPTVPNLSLQHDMHTESSFSGFGARTIWSEAKID